MEEEVLLRRRLEELANRSYTQNQYTFSNFLNAMEISSFLSSQREYGYVSSKLYGGYDGCERQMIRFGSEESLGYDMPFPIQCIHVQPMVKKFADQFTHRDFLGALMNLGMERNMIGDIIVYEQSAYVFCHEKMTSYIMDNLDQVKHTHMVCKLGEELPQEILQHYEEVSLIVESERIDGIVAKLLHLSRSKAVLLFQEKKVFVNAKLCENNNYLLKVNDIISIRGFGKAIYLGIQYQTKKEKWNVKVKKYK